MACSAGKAIFIPAQHSQADVFRADTTHCLIAACSNTLLEKFREVGVELPKHALFFKTDFTSIIAKLEQELSEADTFSSLMVEGFRLEALVRANRHARCDFINHPPVWLRRVKELLQDDAANVKSISSIAAAVGVHPVRLATDFRRAYGCTPGEFLRGVRVQYAVELLKDSDDRNCDIAARCGFSNQAHLTRLFQKQMNCSPAQFRRRFSY
jgi:AraC family transcriptional regulator